MARQDDQFNLRLPDGLRDDIKAAAKANGRSMNAEMLDRPYQPTPDDAWADQQVQEALRVLSDYHAREWEAARPTREANARKRMVAWLEHAEGCKARALKYAQWAEEYDEGDPRIHKYRAESIRQQRMHHYAMQQYRREEAGI